MFSFLVIELPGLGCVKHPVVETDEFPGLRGLDGEGINPPNVLVIHRSSLWEAVWSVAIRIAGRGSGGGTRSLLGGRSLPNLSRSHRVKGNEDGDKDGAHM